MLSSNLAVRAAYYATLKTISYDGEDVPVYWQQLPTTVSPGIYIIFGQIRNNDDSNKGASVTQTSVTVSIYSNSPQYNDGIAVDTVANEVLNRLYATPQFNITLGGFFQCLQTSLESDDTQDFSIDSQNTYIDRIMIFNHTIFQNVS